MRCMITDYFINTNVVKPELNTCVSLMDLWESFSIFCDDGIDWNSKSNMIFILCVFLEPWNNFRVWQTGWLWITQNVTLTRILTFLGTRDKHRSPGEITSRKLWPASLQAGAGAVSSSHVILRCELWGAGGIWADFSIVSNQQVGAERGRGG